ncbi:MAG: geranylgeranyl pyrophosphate synthase [Acidimicrobiales bacterium]|jgi:geranylgeranyl diphosphate synthase type I|nr:geranylgeranyl pyrophosphate synthase [Acidimicrobiales bacterium]
MAAADRERARVSSVAAPTFLEGIARAVEARIAAVLDEEIARWSSLEVDLAEPLTALRSFILAGGKRLRPAFCHWAFVGAGGSAGDSMVVDAGAALELLHTFALIHDDIMDGSSTRRAVDTIHIEFESRHALEGWRGEGRRFGEGVAILVGDLAFVYADRLLAGAPADALDVFGELRVEVNVGQYLDLLGTARGDVDRASARRISLYKSGKYTVERPLHLGAALAGRLDDFGGPLTAYGLPLGEAFQLRDDLLGVFGDAGVTGKPVGDDLREGKPTALVAIAAERVDGAGRRLLDRLGSPDLTDVEIASLQDLLVDVGAVDEVEATIERLVGAATAALGSVALVGGAGVALAELAAYVAGRDR